MAEILSGFIQFTSKPVATTSSVAKCFCLQRVAKVLQNRFGNLGDVRRPA
ncbi:MULTISPECIES: hypothetical protein [unclassified Neglectibacter]|nr:MULTISPECIES: hypothetical protein [unclassified Neglectibacter]